MPLYGGPGVEIEYTYVAVRPFTAEHPIGSGQMYTFQPGEEFPGEDWGMAAHNLVEVGKAVRLATNVTPHGSGSPEEAAPMQNNEVTGYPHHEGAGYYTLSNGDKVRGKETAFAAQEELDSSGS